MHPLTLHRLGALALPMDLVRQLTAISELKGRQDLYRVQVPQVLESLRQVAAIQSTESSNRLENVIVEPRRLKELMANTSPPRTRPEYEVAGYRDVLQTIHGSWEYIPLTPGTVLQLHRDLYRYTPQPGGRWKQGDNQITERWPDGTVRVRFADTTPAYQTSEAMEVLCPTYRQLRDQGSVDDLVLIAAFVLDFLCIHPFGDGNGRLARLLTLLLLYQAGHQVGRFISLERLVEVSKDTYYDSLRDSSQGWRQGENDLLPWLSYFLGVIQAAYKELAQRVDQVHAAPGVKGQLVRHAIAHIRQPFTLQDLLSACPTISQATIRSVLNRLRDEGKVECIERGRNARWVRN